MSDRWTDRLSEYLDGGLAPAETRELETHLQGCTECATALDGLRRIVERARSLESVPPPEDLWPMIASRIGASGSIGRAAGSTVHRSFDGWRLTLSVPQLAAAAALLVVFSAAGAWLVARSPVPGPRATAVQPLQGAASNRVAGFDTRHYEDEIAELRQALENGRERLDPATVRVLEDNLRTIERAVEQAKRALAADPGNTWVRKHLQENVDRKIELMKRATLLASAQG